MKAPKCSRFDKTVNRPVQWNQVQDWTERMVDQVFRQALPGEEIELKIVIDFKNAPRYQTQDQKDELIQKINEIESSFIPR
ncbi:hypothetical protein Q1695_007954 [Nippostrongylus brasiliensis]|nr:hypothetical protein Q1695_007954 [Nippostrongylus brasiliensis]